MNEKAKGTLYIIMAAVLFASGGLALKFVDWNPLAINGIRSFFGALVLGAFLFFTKHKIKWNKTVLLGAVSYMAMTTLFVMANKLTTAANTIVLQYSCPIWIILLSALFLKKKPNSLEIKTVIVVLAGILCFFADSLKSGNVFGDGIAVISGLFYAVMFMLNSFKEGDALSSVFIGQIISFLLFGGFVFQETNFSYTSMLAVFWLGAFQVGAAYIFFCLATARISPLQASLIGAIEPILNPLLVAVFWHEQLSFLAMIGAVIVIGAVTFYSAAGTLTKKEPEKAAA